MPNRINHQTKTIHKSETQTYRVHPHIGMMPNAQIASMMMIMEMMEATMEMMETRETTKRMIPNPAATTMVKDLYIEIAVMNQPNNHHTATKHLVMK